MKPLHIESILLSIYPDIQESYIFNNSLHKPGVWLSKDKFGKATINSLRECCKAHRYFHITSDKIIFFNLK